MSRKKLRLDRSVEVLSRDPAHCSFTALEKFGLLSMLMSVSADGDDAVEFKRAASELVASGNHGSIRGSWPMAISGYPRGHNV
jgi:hypothetical protein